MFVVAIPVRNERDRIIACLQALASQVDVPPKRFGILLFLNNCTDGTRDLIDAWMATAICAARVVERDSASASAGWARREAMNAAAAWLEEAEARNGVLLTTDADSRVPKNWLALNEAALAAGADAVAGRIDYDPIELAALPRFVRERQRLESKYEMLLAEIEARLHPSPGDPWPRHWTRSGASIAVSLDAYRKVGGLPPTCSGEDGAFIDLLRAHGLVVRHAPNIVVTTSVRLDGRAADGVAATLKRRSLDAQSPCDARLERLGVFVLRTLLRRLGVLRLGAPEPRRASRLLRPKDLPRQIRRARLLLRLLRALEGRRGDTCPSRPVLASPSPNRLSTP